MGPEIKLVRPKRDKRDFPMTPTGEAMRTSRDLCSRCGCGCFAEKALPVHENCEGRLRHGHICSGCVEAFTADMYEHWTDLPTAEMSISARFFAPESIKWELLDAWNAEVSIREYRVIKEREAAEDAANEDTRLARDAERLAWYSKSQNDIATF